MYPSAFYWLGSFGRDYNRYKLIMPLLKFNLHSFIILLLTQSTFSHDFFSEQKEEKLKNNNNKKGLMVHFLYGENI